jgi:hypothetical protein
MLQGCELVLSFLRVSKSPIQGQIKFAGKARGPYDVRTRPPSCVCVRDLRSPSICRSGASLLQMRQAVDANGRTTVPAIMILRLRAADSRRAFMAE